jgi:hypothetical protein
VTKREKPPTIKERLLKIAAVGASIQEAPKHPGSPSGSLPLFSLGDVQNQINLLTSYRKSVTPTPHHTTLSDSKLFTYEGAVLGCRQLILQRTGVLGLPIPEEFANAAPKFVATFFASLLSQGAFTEPMVSPFVAPFSPIERELIDAWETCGLGVAATDAFLLSHIYRPTTNSWTPFTPSMEEASWR